MRETSEPPVPSFPPRPISTPLIETLKGSTVPIGFGDLRTALTTGLVDVQENSLSVFRFVRLQEVHKFILLSGHTYAVGVLGINNAFYIQLSPDERAAIDGPVIEWLKSQISVPGLIAETLSAVRAAR